MQQMIPVEQGLDWTKIIVAVIGSIGTILAAVFVRKKTKK